jgi:hypothetical protein
VLQQLVGCVAKQTTFRLKNVLRKSPARGPRPPTSVEPFVHRGRYSFRLTRNGSSPPKQTFECHELLAPRRQGDGFVHRFMPGVFCLASGHYLDPTCLLGDAVRPLKRNRLHNAALIVCIVKMHDLLLSQSI